LVQFSFFDASAIDIDTILINYTITVIVNAIALNSEHPEDEAV